MSESKVSYQPDRDLATIAVVTSNGDVLAQDLQFQHGPIGENGINGVQDEDVLDLLAVRLRSLNAAFPCRENSIAITHIETARLWLEERTRIRQHQGVEGKNEAHVS